MSAYLVATLKESTGNEWPKCFMLCRSMLGTDSLPPSAQARLVSLYLDTKRYQEALTLGEFDADG